MPVEIKYSCQHNSGISELLTKGRIPVKCVFHCILSIMDEPFSLLFVLSRTQSMSEDIYSYFLSEFIGPFHPPYGCPYITFRGQRPNM